MRRSRPAGRPPPFEADEPSIPVAPPPRAGETRLARALREEEWVVSVELDPPKGGSLDGLVEVTRTLQESGRVGFVDVNDNPMARARMNALMTASTLQREVGIETIPHVTPRDTTVMGLEGVLLGAHAEGVRNVLAVTGDPPHVGDYPGSRGVYEVDSIGLVQLLAGLNRGEDYVGKALDAPTEFFVGVAVNPSADDLDLELDRFRRKIDAGAHFAMTQAIFDVELLDRFVERLGGSWPIPVLLGVWPLRSHGDGAAAPQRGPGHLRAGPRAGGAHARRPRRSASRDSSSPAHSWTSRASASRASTSSRPSSSRSARSTCSPEHRLPLDAGSREWRPDVRERLTDHVVRGGIALVVGAGPTAEQRRDDPTVLIHDRPAGVAALHGPA